LRGKHSVFLETTSRGRVANPSREGGRKYYVLASKTIYPGKTDFFRGGEKEKVLGIEIPLGLNSSRG